MDTQVTEREFVEQLHELNHKINFVKEQSFKEAKSCTDVKDILEKLKIKVMFFSEMMSLFIETFRVDALSMKIFTYFRP